jgi:hypothetical protein
MTSKFEQIRVNCKVIKVFYTDHCLFIKCDMKEQDMILKIIGNPLPDGGDVHVVSTPTNQKCLEIVKFQEMLDFYQLNIK